MIFIGKMHNLCCLFDTLTEAQLMCKSTRNVSNTLWCVWLSTRWQQSLIYCDNSRDALCCISRVNQQWIRQGRKQLLSCSLLQWDLSMFHICTHPRPAMSNQVICLWQLIKKHLQWRHWERSEQRCDKPESLKLQRAVQSYVIVHLSSKPPLILLSSFNCDWMCCEAISPVSPLCGRTCIRC